MDEMTFRHLIAAHARFPAAFLAVFQDCDEALLRSREREGTWSPLEILAHLRDEEVEDFRPRAIAALARRPIEKPIDPQGWVTARRYNEMDPGAVYLDWAAERADSCRWLGTVNVADLENFVDHPVLGRMRAGDFIAAWRLHDLLHMRQFSTALSVLTAQRFATWRVDYAGTIPGSLMRVPERFVLAGIVAALAVAALLPASAVTFVLLAALSGAPLALRLGRRWDPIELFGVSVAMSLVLFAIATPILHKMGAGEAVRFVPALLGTVVLATARRPRRLRFTFRAATFAFAAVVGIAAAWVALRNGPSSSGGAPTYEARSWYARDSFYLFALVESARAHGGAPPENPFLSGAPNLYPTALHGALAGMLGADQRPSAVALARPFVLFLVASAGLLVATARRWGSGRDGPLFAGAIGAFLLRPDFFVYPQSQPLALLVLLLLIGCLSSRPWRAPRRGIGLAALLGAGLPFAHTVTAGVATAVLGGAVLISMAHRRFGRAAVLGVAALAAVMLFLALNRAPAPGPGGGVWDAGAWTLVRRYDTAWILPLAGLLLLLFAPARVTPAVRIAATGALALGAAYTAFGVSRLDSVERWFVIFNAQRFFLLSLVVAMPLLVARPKTIAWTAAGLFIAGALAMPGEVARDTLLLVRGEPLVLPASRLEALDAVRRTAPAGARFVTTALDHALPAFTGRAQLANDSQNLWGMNTISPRDFALRLASQERCFADLTPRQRGALLDHFGITHLMLDGRWPDDKAALQWIGANLPPGDARPLFRNSEVLVVERGTGDASATAPPAP